MYGASTHKFMYGNRPQAKGRCELDGTGNIMESISLIEDGEQPGRSTLSYLRRQRKSVPWTIYAKSIKQQRALLGRDAFTQIKELRAKSA